MANPTTNYGFVLPTSSDLVTDLPADFDVALQGVDTRLKALQPGTTLGDLAYSSATANTNTRLGIGTAGQVLSVVAGVPAWTTGTTGDIEGVTAGTGISGGGTSGTVTVTNSMATAITTAGDLIKGTGSGTFDRLGIGSTGQVLTVASGAPSWATPAAGGLTLSSVANGTASGASLSITGLSAYNQIDFMITGITQTNNDNFLFRINSNTGGNYQTVSLIQSGSTSDFTQGSTETSFVVTPNDAKGATQSNQALYVRLTNCLSGFTTCQFIHYYRNNAGTGFNNWQMGTYKVSEAVSSFQLTVASGTISGGSYRVFAG